MNRPLASFVLLGLVSTLAGFRGGHVHAPADHAAIDQGLDHHKVVRVHIDSRDDMDFVRSLGGRLLSCREGLVPTDYVMTPEALLQLELSPLHFDLVSDDIQKDIDAERARIALAAQVNPRDAAWYDEYKTIDEIDTLMNTLVASYPNLVTKTQIGTSLQNRPIFALTITSPVGTNKPAVCFNGTQHAREWISPMTVSYIAERLASTYATDPIVQALLDELTFYLVPIVNPDGYVYAWDSVRLWRKNRRDNGDGTFGIDLNRNWEIGWGDEGSVGESGNDLYRGPSPFSEPETQSLRDFILDHPDIIAHIDFHNYSQEVLRPIGYDYIDPPEPDNTNLATIGDAMAAAIFSVHGASYLSIPSVEHYPAGGVCTDWVYGAADIYSWTIELRPQTSTQGGFQLPADQILPTVEENFAAITSLGDWARAQSRVDVELPNGAPPVMAPSVSQVFDVQIVPLGESIAPGSPTLHYRYDGGTFLTAPLTATGGLDYEATLPGGGCSETPEYYISVEGTASGVVTLPADAPTTTLSTPVGALMTVFADDFESDQGWTAENLGASSGSWQRGVPVDDETWEYDPVSDADGSGQCYLTDNQNGNTDVDGGSVRLTSPTFELVDGGAITYDYLLRLSDMDGNDRMLVEITDGIGAWTEIARHDEDTWLVWFRNEISSEEVVAASVGLTATMQVRFTVNDANAQSIVEAGLDRFIVSRVDCDAQCPDTNGDLTINTDDFLTVLANWGASGGPADVNGDNIVNTDDFLAVLASWGDC